MKKLYSDLKDKGLEIVGVTTYYGYYGNEGRPTKAGEKPNLPRDTEFSRLGDFIKEKELPWPVVVGERENHQAYGVSGIPHLVVIGRDGRVIEAHIGYSSESFAKFRTEIEELLKK